MYAPFMRTIIFAALALTGCASTADVMGNNPSFVGQSNKSVDALAFCLADRNNSNALDFGDGSKVIQIKNSIGAVGVSMRVFPEEEGSRLEVRKGNSPISFVKYKSCL